MITLQNIHKAEGEHLLLEIPALQVGAGEVVALVGAVGSGKETLLQLLTGKARPSMGSVQVCDIDPGSDHDDFSQKVGVLFAEDGLYETRSPKANLDFFCRVRGLPQERTPQVLAQVGLADQADAKLKGLSSGMRRRLAFGRVLLHQPQAYILEEPLARCDGASIQVLAECIQQTAEQGAAVLILAGEDTQLNRICDTIHTLDQGRITGSYKPQELAEGSLPFKVPVRLEGKVALVNPADILFADVQDGRAYLQTLSERLPTQFTLSELEERLARRGFFRAHRAYLVNLQHVKEVIPYTRNSFSLRLDNEGSTTIPLSKQAAAELRDLLDY